MLENDGFVVSLSLSLSGSVARVSEGRINGNRLGETRGGGGGHFKVRFQSIEILERVREERRRRKARAQRGKTKEYGIPAAHVTGEPWNAGARSVNGNCAKSEATGC